MQIRLIANADRAALTPAVTIPNRLARNETASRLLNINRSRATVIAWRRRCGLSRAGECTTENGATDQSTGNASSDATAIGLGSRSRYNHRAGNRSHRNERRNCLLHFRLLNSRSTRRAGISLQLTNLTLPT